MRLSHKLSLTAAMDVTLKTHGQFNTVWNTFNTFYWEKDDIVNIEFLSYNLSSAGVLVCVRWSSYVVPHLA